MTDRTSIENKIIDDIREKIKQLNQDLTQCINSKRGHDDRTEKLKRILKTLDDIEPNEPPKPSDVDTNNSGPPESVPPNVQELPTGKLRGFFDTIFQDANGTDDNTNDDNTPKPQGVVPQGAVPPQVGAGKTRKKKKGLRKNKKKSKRRNSRKGRK